ncbi:heterokaryon incompatibility protein-domain-containing protein [Podospora aff. communis PSN243]|uniref:Heterokaryon incompatibility protein-domain-containing protein n=1 Tax=Podospora aff. communis PSN243 TaxID=3040156 RepID=A0AAV9GGQ5_9PEZI|nr:heterokaryon incompatibility protein-domain-containing protein [Podospora aff. communis PSN243]
MATSTQTDPRHTLYRSIDPNEFRVVHLLPGTFQDEIRCVLETRPRNLKTRYKALSYQWGDASITNPIRIAHLDPPPKTKSPIRTCFSSTTLTLKARKRSTELKMDHSIRSILRVFSWLIGTTALYALLFHPFVEVVDAPPWASRFVSRDVYFLLFSILAGQGPVELILGARDLSLEVLRTKPWTLASVFNVNEHPDLRFHHLQVTKNLAMALRYLRDTKRPVTLWIDALCINQADEDEKQLQIQRMDWVFANATPVLVWLGGYHETEATRACEDGDDCEHKQQMQVVFNFIWARSGWRRLVPSYLKGGTVNAWYPRVRSGLSELHKRGWWERLWVVQEVALATAPPLVQCGEHSCHFEDFWHVHFEARVRNYDDNEILDKSQAAEQFRTVTKEFKFSEYDDVPETEKAIGELVGIALNWTFGLFGADVDKNKTQFRKQSFDHRIERLLLRTAGRFKCHDDRDRLYAVLGIAAGSIAGPNTKIRNFIRQLSAFSTASAVSRMLNPVYNSMEQAAQRVMLVLSLAFGLWLVYYDRYAKHWAINRAGYVVKSDDKAPASMMAKLKPTTGRIEFFTTLASYLATNTRTLAFLDAANYWHDKDCDMPSWVPTWEREVTEQAYHFAIRIKRDGQARDHFEFSPDNKTLTVLGRPRGIIHVVRSQAPGASTPQPTTNQRIFERWLVLPSDLRAILVKALVETFKILKRADESEENARLGFDSFKQAMEFGERLLQKGGDILVYSFDRRAREMGFLRAGEANKGDSIVLVPGCYNHLVLRRHIMPEGIRWKLVGLVEMGTEESRHVACPEAEWTEYTKEGGVFKYAIV